MNRQKIQERRQRVLTLLAKGFDQSTIARSLEVSQPTIHRDIEALKKDSRNYVNEIARYFGFYYQKCIQGIDEVLSESWTMYYNNKNDKIKLQALSLAKECCVAGMKDQTPPSLIKKDSCTGADNQERGDVYKGTHAPASNKEKNSSEKSRIPINLNDLIWDLEQHYTRISKIAKNTDTNDKSFGKTYVILKDLAKALVELMKLRGIESGEESLAEIRVTYRGSPLQ